MMSHNKLRLMFRFRSVTFILLFSFTAAGVKCHVAAVNVSPYLIFLGSLRPFLYMYLGRSTPIFFFYLFVLCKGNIYLFKHYAIKSFCQASLVHLDIMYFYVYFCIPDIRSYGDEIFKKSSFFRSNPPSKTTTSYFLISSAPYA